MHSPPNNIGEDLDYISTRTFIVAATTSYETLRRFQLVANNVNKRLLCHRFFTLSVPAFAFCAAKLHKKTTYTSGYAIFLLFFFFFSFLAVLGLPERDDYFMLSKYVYSPHSPARSFVE